MNENGTAKQGIGWNEKEGYITGIKTSKNNQIQQFKQLLEGIFQLIRGKINEIIDFNKFKLDLQSLDKQQYYQTETKEQKELKYKWLETQQHELSMIKQSLEDVLSSF
jgi:hypothetical protein